MSNSKSEYICWSCAKPLPQKLSVCPDCREPAILSDPKPLFVPPSYGKVFNTKEIPAEGPFLWPCCACQKNVVWDDIDHFLIGPCSSCGAWGMFGAVEEC